MMIDHGAYSGIGVSLSPVKPSVLVRRSYVLYISVEKSVFAFLQITHNIGMARKLVGR